jgi:hypothetical protein
MGLQHDFSLKKLKEQANLFFESQLKGLGLSLKDIEQQSIPQLEDSLERVNDALRVPESFGVIRLRIASAMSVLVTANAESHIELGVVPVLLERKKVIVARLRQLCQERPITNVAELIDTIANQDLRKQLFTELEAMRQKVKAEQLEPEIQKGLAFVAMAMDPDNPQLDDVIDAIKEGVAKCGVKAERIDEVLSNERITDRLLDSVKEAEFVVVDLSYARPNVYYEAGYAQGLGKTPVYIAKAGTEIHFDLKDYPIIYYESMRQLKAALASRLSAINSGRS